MTAMDRRNSKLVAQHVDAIVAILGGYCVGLMMFNRDGEAEQVCPGDGREQADAWLVQRVAYALERSRP